MADTNTNQQPADDASNKKKFDSPWDEELPPEEPKKAKVVGSLETKPSELTSIGGDKKPVPFNIPTDVSEEKVGKKILAETVIPQPNVSAPINNTTFPKPTVQNTDQGSVKPIQAKPVNKIEPEPIKKQASKMIDKPVPTAMPAPIAMATAKPAEPVRRATTPIQTKPIPVAKPEIKPVVPLTVSKNGELPKSISSTMTKISEPKEAGVNELIQPKKGTVSVPQLAQSPKPVPVVLPPKPEIKTEPVKVVSPVTPPEKVPIYPAPVAKLKPESEAMADIRPADKIRVEVPPPILPNISKPIDLLNEEEEKPLAETISPTEPAEKIKAEKKPAPPEIRKPIKSNEPPFYKKAKFLIPVVVIFLFVLGVYLTEAGLISIGLEKVYGLTGVESLWGGLPRNPEKALGISAQTMQKQLNFKIKGTVSMTVNKTIKSPIISPLVSSINLPFAFRDTNTIAGINALTTQYDYYGSDNTSGTSTTDTSTYDSTTSSSTDTSSDTSTTDTTTSILGDQSNDASYTPEESTIKQVDADIEGQSSDQAIKTDLLIKKLVGSGSTVSLLSTKNQLFVKSSQDIKFATNADTSKWLEFNISAVQNENPFKDLTNIKLDQGFSIIGRRSGNEKMGAIRCFKYSIDNLEIGDSLDFLGIEKDSVQKIEGNIWIGVADHYLHKVDLKIIPSISSSISQMSITLEMYDYGIENSIQIPALADKIIANITVDPNATATSTTTTTTTPSVASAVTMEERDQTRKADLQSIKVALEKYKIANGKFPIANTMIHLDTKDNVVQKALVAEFIASLPTDPKAGEGWYYGYQSSGSKFTLSARLENPADKQVTKVGDIYLHWVYNN